MKKNEKLIYYFTRGEVLCKTRTGQRELGDSDGHEVKGITVSHKGVRVALGEGNI